MEHVGPNEKVHTVREKWKRKREREETEHREHPFSKQDRDNIERVLIILRVAIVG
jgi:hypothetical protein